MLRLDHVSKDFPVGAFGGRSIRAVDDVSFEIARGEVLALIGESGSGKTTIGRMILRLAAPTAGAITFDGADVAARHRAGLKAYYARVQGVFQDPFSSFNPIFKADRIFSMIHHEFFPAIDERAWRDKLLASLEGVGLNPSDVLAKYPHELSGGQLQRLLIARALLLDIDLLVADEVISMLDASTRIDVLNLIGDLKARGLAVVFITHDLSLGHYISDSTVILRRGRVVERGSTAKVFADPRHAYTRMLLESVPQIGTHWTAERRTEAPGGNGAGPLVEIDDDHFVAVDDGDAAAAEAA